ncbi:MAG: hypothetical protein JRH01_15095 [Deltaproteobacteria bacterium]|nr:hypothetical protein [Deltaproteobacteria bacterium]
MKTHHPLHELFRGRGGWLKPLWLYTSPPTIPGRRSAEERREAVMALLNN